MGYVRTASFNIAQIFCSDSWKFVLRDGGFVLVVVTHTHPADIT